MKAYEIGEQQGLQSLTLTQRTPPAPGFGEVALKVRAVCLNHRDLRVLEGRYGARKPTHRIPVSDGIGEVIAVGTGVMEKNKQIQLGQRVIAPHFASWIDGAFNPAVFAQDLGISVDGWLAEQILVPASALIAVPDSLSDEDAATLSAAGLTAWNALVEVSRIKAGDLVLALGTGGVSIFALQIAKMHGARVAITSSSDNKLAFARSLGADITINYRTQPDWAAALLQASDGAGADLIVETGGVATLGQSIAAAAPNARIALIGALAGTTMNVPDFTATQFTTILLKNLSLHGITAGSRRMLQDLLRAVVAHGLKPVISHRFGFDEVPAAYACLQSGEHVGKVLIRLT